MTSHCSEFDRLEGELAGVEPGDAILEHLRTCGVCKRNRRRHRALDRLISRAGPSELAAALRVRAPGRDAPPSDVPGYEILGQIGSGGQGVVFKAIQTSTRRTVALKMLPPERFPTSNQQRRFEREIELAAQLRHPGIVSVYDSGMTESGTHYFAMEYIEGVTLDRHMRRRAGSLPQGVCGVPVRESLRLFARIASTVHHAHQRGVLHRDLKPANILVDPEGEPHIVDFGLARPLEAGKEVSPEQITATGVFMGTYAYAAPEQLDRDPGEIDVRTDVYALGVILYEMLTGSLPYPVGGSLSEVVRNIREREPRNPSTLNPRIRYELRAILCMALAKEKERRYPSVLTLTQDVQHYLAGEGVEAKRGHRWYQIRKALRRYKVASLIAAACLLLVTFFSINQARHARRLRLEKARLSRALREGNVTIAQLHAQLGNGPASERILWKEHLGAVLEGSAGKQREPRWMPGLLETHWMLWDLYRRWPCLATWRAHEGAVSGLAFSPDGRTLISSGGDATLRSWEVATRRRLLSIETGHGSIGVLSLSRAGTVLAAGCRDGAILVWDWPPEAPPAVLPGEVAVLALDLTADGKMLASVDGGGEVRIVDPQDPGGARRLAGRGAALSSVRFDPAGRRVAVAGDWTQVWDLPSGRLLFEAKTTGWMEASWVGWSPAGKRLACGGRFRRTRLWRVGPRGGIEEGAGPRGEATKLGFLDDSARVAWIDATSPRIWIGRLDEPRASWVDLVSPGAVRLACDPTGRILATGHADGSVRLWDVSPGAPPVSWQAHSGTVHSVRFGPKGRYLASGGADRRIRLWEASSGRELSVQSAHGDLVACVAFSPGGGMLASASSDRTVRLWKVPSLGPIRVAGEHEDCASWVEFSPDGRLLASSGNDRVIRVRDLRRPREPEAILRHARRISSFTFSPDGAAIVAGDTSGALLLWDLASAGVSPLEYPGPRLPVRCVAVSPDGKLVAAGGDDLLIRIWSLGDRRMIRSLEGHSDSVFAIAFDPGGRLLASGDRAGVIRFWSVSTGSCVAILDEQRRFSGGGGQAVFSLDFDRDGTTLVAGITGGRILTWDLTYFDQHIAGNLAFQLEKAPPAARASNTARVLRRWAGEVLARPHPAYEPR